MSRKGFKFQNERVDVLVNSEFDFAIEVSEIGGTEGQFEEVFSVVFEVDFASF